MWLQSSSLPFDLILGGGGGVLQDKVFLWERAVCSAEIDYRGVYNTEKKLMLTANVKKKKLFKIIMAQVLTT